MPISTTITTSTLSQQQAIARQPRGLALIAPGLKHGALRRHLGNVHAARKPVTYSVIFKLGNKADDGVTAYYSVFSMKQMVRRR